MNKMENYIEVKSDSFNTGVANVGKHNTGNGNIGNKNSGHFNVGDYNVGSFNIGTGNLGEQNCGQYNSGHCNYGNSNSGWWNKGNEISGNLNSERKNVEFSLFNKECSSEDWIKVEKPSFLFKFQLTRFCEKRDKDSKKIVGYLKTFTYEEAWQNAYKEATKEDIALLKALPNFDADVFEEITGIRVK